MHKNVLVSTDCVCDIPPKYLKRYQVPIMYYYVKVESGRFQDTKEVSSDSIAEYLMSGDKTARTEAADVSDYVEFFEGLRKRHDGPIIHLCMAKGISEGYERALEAGRQFQDIHVVDSGHLSAGMGILVMLAADMAWRGAVAEVILKRIEELKPLVSTSFTVRSTEALCRNEKISSNVHALFSRWFLHPILVVKNSKMGVGGIVVGGQRRFAKAYLRKAFRRKKRINKDVVFVITAGCSYEFIQFLKQEVKRMVPFKRVVVHVASATVCCNCGDGAFGVLFLRK